MAIILSPEGTAQSPPLSEYKVKAVFLYNFTKFVDWPSTSFDSSNAPFIISIVGDDPFGTRIDETVAGEKVKGHPIIINRYQHIKEITHCHILYVNLKLVPGTDESIHEIPAEVLTVGESSNFNIAGGMIRFITKENRVKLIINPLAVKAAELTMSSKLLSVADIFVR